MRLEESLSQGKDEQADREGFRSWLELNDVMREINLDMVYDTLDIEEMEDVISTYPNICKDEEQRMEKLALVEERNDLRVELDTKYWGDSVEQDRLRLAELWVALLMKEVRHSESSLLTILKTFLTPINITSCATCYVRRSYLAWTLRRARSLRRWTYLAKARTPRKGSES